MKAINKVLDFIFPKLDQNPLADFGGDLIKDLHNDANENGGLVMNNDCRERMIILIQHIEKDRKKHTETFLGGMTFFIITMIGIWSSVPALNIMGMFALVITMWWWAKGSSLFNRIQNQVGFVDGMMYVAFQLGRDINEAKMDEETLSEIKEQVEADLTKVKQQV